MQCSERKKVRDQCSTRYEEKGIMVVLLATSLIHSTQVYIHLLISFLTKGASECSCIVASYIFAHDTLSRLTTLYVSITSYLCVPFCHICMALFLRHLLMVYK